jgi:hypothetical protein
VHFICISFHVPPAPSQSALVIGVVEGGGEYVAGVPACGAVPGDALGVLMPELIPELPVLVWSLSDGVPFVSPPSVLPPLSG